MPSSGIYRSLVFLWNSISQQLADLGGRTLAARECSRHPRSGRHHSSTRRRSAARLPGSDGIQRQNTAQHLHTRPSHFRGLHHRGSGI
jgi:hypothetical protein